MSTQIGYLTIFSSDRTEIYGEFADAGWKSEITEGGTNYVFTGTASQGTYETFLQLDKNAISHVLYSFESNGHSYVGKAEFLAPVSNDASGQPQIRFETGEPLKMA